MVANSKDDILEDRDLKVTLDESKIQSVQIEQTLKELAKIPKPDTATGAGIGTPKRALVMAGAGAAGALHGPVGAM